MNAQMLTKHGPKLILPPPARSRVGKQQRQALVQKEDEETEAQPYQ